MSKITQIVVVSKEGDNIAYVCEDINNYKPVIQEKALSHSYVMDVLRKLMGRTLTLIDATITDKTQNKSIKDIIRGHYSDEIEFLGDTVYDSDEIEELANESFEALSKEEQEEVLKNTVTIEEALGVK